MIDKSVFLGEPRDPEPVWREESPDAFAWPEDAIFGVTFESTRFPGLDEELIQLPLTEFYGADGWPIELPENQKKSLPQALKRELQVFPWHWRRWSERDWNHAIRFTKAFTISRIQGAITSAMAQIIDTP